MSKVNKSIEVLTDFEHIIKRPTMYVGSVKKSDEVLPIIGDGFIKSVTKEHSIGMYKLFDEVFANSVDEAKRMQLSMKKITVEIAIIINKIALTITVVLTEFLLPMICCNSGNFSIVLFNLKN